MGIVKKYYEQAGGKSLIKQYWRTGALIPAIIQFILLGRSKRALELLRLTVSLKVQERLRRKYGKYLISTRYDSTLIHEESKVIWIFWWQGIESAPNLVKGCYRSVIDNFTDWDIVLVTKNNYEQYVEIPLFIIQKLDEGAISLTHFSDILRLELLIKHGGLWLDATVFCSSGLVPSSVLHSDLFVFQVLKPGSDGRAISMSSWCMYAKTNNIILLATRDLLYQYWKKNSKMDDYFLLHHFFSIACDNYPEEAQKIPPFCNSIPHILLLHLFDKYDEQYWNDLRNMSCFHKLSYKLDEEKLSKKGTYFDVLINER